MARSTVRQCSVVGGRPARTSSQLFSSRFQRVLRGCLEAPAAAAAAAVPLMPHADGLPPRIRVGVYLLRGGSVPPPPPPLKSGEEGRADMDMIDCRCCCCCCSDGISDRFRSAGGGRPVRGSMFSSFSTGKVASGADRLRRLLGQLPAASIVTTAEGTRATVWLGGGTAVGGAGAENVVLNPAPAAGCLNENLWNVLPPVSYHIIRKKWKRRRSG